MVCLSNYNLIRNNGLHQSYLFIFTYFGRMCYKILKETMDKHNKSESIKAILNNYLLEIDNLKKYTEGFLDLSGNNKITYTNNKNKTITLNMTDSIRGSIYREVMKYKLIDNFLNKIFKIKNGNYLDLISDLFTPIKTSKFESIFHQISFNNIENDIILHKETQYKYYIIFEYFNAVFEKNHDFPFLEIENDQLGYVPSFTTDIEYRQKVIRAIEGIIHP